MTIRERLELEEEARLSPLATLSSRTLGRDVYKRQPISRRNLVLSKYLLSFMFSVAGALLSMLVNVLMDGHFGESLQTSAMLACAGMIFASLILPVLFRFGVEKGKLIMMALVMLPTLLILSLIHI